MTRLRDSLNTPPFAGHVIGFSLSGFPLGSVTLLKAELWSRQISVRCVYILHISLLHLFKNNVPLIPVSRSTFASK